MFESVVCEKAAILSRPQWVKRGDRHHITFQLCESYQCSRCHYRHYVSTMATLITCNMTVCLKAWSNNNNNNNHNNHNNQKLPHYWPFVRICWSVGDSPHQGPIQKAFPCHNNIMILLMLQNIINLHSYRYSGVTPTRVYLAERWP